MGIKFFFIGIHNMMHDTIKLQYNNIVYGMVGRNMDD